MKKLSVVIQCVFECKRFCQLEKSEVDVGDRFSLNVQVIVAHNK